MSSLATVLQALRQFKNTIISAVAERVMMEQMYDQNGGNAPMVRRCSIVETVSLAAAAQGTLTTSLPAGAKVIFAGLYWKTAFTLVTGTNLSIGTAASPGAFFISSTTMTIDNKEAQPSADAASRVAVATPIKFTTTNGAGALTGTGTGTAKVFVIYEYAQLPVA